MTTVLLPPARMAVPRITRAAIVRALRAGLAPLKAQPPQRLGDWAGDHFFLSAEGSHTTGDWRAWPFQIGILDWMSDDCIEELDVKKSKRVGYTKMLLAFMAFNAAHRRRKLALWQPTDDDRDSFVKSEVEPMLRDVKALRAVIPRKAADATIKLKTFLGSVWHLLGGKAARAYRRITVAVALLDEIDGFDQLIEKSSDPVTLAYGRLEGAPFPKLVAGTTPRIKGLSHIEHRFDMAKARMFYNIECPRCGVQHPLTWGGKSIAHGFKWEAGKPETARHVCPHCHESITQAEYLACWERGEWVDEQHRYRYGVDRMWRDETGAPCRPPRHVAVHVWAIYSPQRTWESIAREHMEAEIKLKAGDHGPMQGFMNETRGETWELQGDSADEHVLSKRAEAYRLGTVPVGCLRLVAGLDTQDDRVECVVWGFGEGEEMWVIDYQVFYFNPASESEWSVVDDYLDNAAFTKLWDGGSMGIEASAIDTQGHFTHQVYYWVRQRAHRQTFAVRGGNKYGQPIKGGFTPQDIKWNGTKIRNGARLYEIGTDTAKDLIYGRLGVERKGPGYVHFSNELPQKFYNMLTAEKRVLVKMPTGEESRWIKVRQRNEPLDCTVYALFCAQMLGIHVMKPLHWQRLRDRVQPPRDLFTEVAVVVGAAAGESIEVEEVPGAQPPWAQNIPPAAAREQRRPERPSKRDW